MFFFSIAGTILQLPAIGKGKEERGCSGVHDQLLLQVANSPSNPFSIHPFFPTLYRQLFEISSLHIFSIANDLMFFLVAESSTAGGAVTNNMIAIICADLLMPYFQGLGRKSLPFGVRPSIIFRGTPVAGPVVRNYD